MTAIKTFFSELMSLFISYPSSTKFKLKKRKRYALIISLLLSMVTLSVLLNHHPSVSNNKANVGDSLLTDIILEKELTQSISKKTISTQEELQVLATESPLSFSFYRILPGENLSSVASKFGLSMATVLSLNSLDNAHSLSVGQKILLSTRSGIIYNTTNKDSVSDIAERHGISAEDITLVNALESEDIQEGVTLFLPNANLSYKAMAEILGYQFINPVPRYRRISSHFGWRIHPILKRRILHTGTDFAAPIGTAIVAAKEGRVVRADWNGGYGLYTEIRHNNGYTTVYAHQSKIHVQPGQWVTAGQHIGAVGNTGRSTGPHLHFEVRKYGRPLNAVFNGLQL